ncbi:Bug family tripartite tricarboxylate transporter substrate binding protein [Allosalinactinospora lopnorensis]|uniref:Bug family tripartite tricarboxylate transporter substrate binding protein n=1 Tax=Allosalinactinospora lopnorensis TaxID=1352348 RepID=UPI000A92DDA4|nr:tripartite tricarboxylate transporter substrate-binding protein [Allosalinactinospora lopnorensis]
MRKICCVFATASLVLATSACGAGTLAEEDAEDYPDQELDWTIAFGPGGGNDIMSRTMVEILENEELYPNDIVVENREGGSGATGWGHVLSQSGDPYTISTTSGSFLTTPLQADTGWTHEDFTGVGLFATDDTLFVVPSDSDIESWEDWLEFAEDEGTVTVGGIGTVNVDFIIQAELAEQAGYEIDYVPFNEEGQMQSALLSGTLDATVSNPGSVLGQVEAEEVTPLLYTGEEPLEVLPDVPTGGDFDYENLVSMPRGLILPPDAPDHAREWWIDTMQQVVETEEWQQYLDDNHLTEDVRWGDDFEAYLEESATGLEETLKEHGAI